MSEAPDTTTTDDKTKNPKLCQTIQDIAGEILKAINEIDQGFAKVQGLAMKTKSFLQSLPPTIPGVPRADLDVLNKLKAACPFIVPFIPSWYNDALNAYGTVLKSFDDMLGGFQNAIADAMAGPIGRLTAPLDKINAAIGEVRGMLNILANALESIIRCMDVFCDVFTADYWKGELARIRGELQPGMEAWFGSEDESLWEGNFLTKQTTRKFNAYTAYIKSEFGGTGFKSKSMTDTNTVSGSDKSNEPAGNLPEGPVGDFNLYWPPDKWYDPGEIAEIA